MRNYRLSVAAAALSIAASTALASELETSPSYSARLQEYERSGDLSWAYRLAWVAAIEERPDLVTKWLRTLLDSGWRMGVDPTAIVAHRLTPPALDLLAALQSSLPTHYRVSDTIATLADPELIPESIAYDTKQRRIYAGSLFRKTVVTLQPDGTLARFSQGALGAVYGIKYDESSDSLWTLHNPQQDGTHRGELVQLDAGGATLRRLSPLNGEPSELNDLCLDDEAVYVTDSHNGRVLSAPRSAEALRTVGTGMSVPYANGIACSPDERFVYVAGATGIYRFDKQTPEAAERLRTPDGVSLGGIDGLYLSKNRLVGIQNALGAPKVVIISISGDIVSEVHFHDVLQPDFRIPTTGFVFGDCLYYIANSSLDALDATGSLNPRAAPPEPARVRGLPLVDRQRACQLGP